MTVQPKAGQGSNCRSNQVFVTMPQSRRTPRHEEIAESLTRDILIGQYRTGERF